MNDLKHSYIGITSIQDWYMDWPMQEDLFLQRKPSIQEELYWFNLEQWLNHYFTN